LSFSPLGKLKGAYIMSKLYPPINFKAWIEENRHLLKPPVVNKVYWKDGDIIVMDKVPHSPQRGANTVGLVIEYPREKGVQDALLWFCENCTTKLYEEDFTLDNIETDMPKIFDKYYGDTDKRSCPNCGEVMQPPKKVQIEE
jgi:3-hydroxyanthranilate 3,4-dioxygenase